MLDYGLIGTRLGRGYILRVSMIDSPSDNVVTLDDDTEDSVDVDCDYSVIGPSFITLSMIDCMCC